MTCAAGEARFAGARRVSEGVWSASLADGTAIPSATLLGYLAEGARTNLLTYSNALATAPWGVYLASCSNNQSVAPDGTTTASKLTVSVGQASGSVYSTISLSGPSTASLSVYAKAGTSQKIRLINSISGVGLGAASAVTQEGNGSGTLSGGTSKISYVGNGWYRCSIDGLVSSSQSHVFIVSGYVDSSTVYLWGAQLEAGAFASSYIPTTTAAVTRNGDDLYYPAGNLSGLTGSVIAQIAISGVSTVEKDIVVCSSGQPLYIGGTTKRPFLFDGAARSSSLLPFIESSSVQGIASSWGGSACVIALNGASTGPLTFDGDLNISGVLRIAGNSGINSISGTIRNVRIFSQALPDATLKAMTT